MYHMGNGEIQLLTGSCEVKWGQAVVTTSHKCKIGAYRQPRKTGEPVRKTEGGTSEKPKNRQNHYGIAALILDKFGAYRQPRKTGESVRKIDGGTSE